MLDIRKNSELSTQNSQTSIAPTADEFYKRNIEKEGEDKLLQFLSFIVDNEEYALELSETSEVIKMREITEVPHAPLFIAGIISLRGEIIPVISLQKRLGLKERDATAETRIAIASYADIKMGLMADRIMGVLRIDPEEIESAPPIHTEVGIEFIRGVVHHKDRLIILLNLPMLLKMEEA